MAKKSKKKVKQDDGVLYFILKGRKYNDWVRKQREAEYGEAEEGPRPPDYADPEGMIHRKYRIKGSRCVETAVVSYSKAKLRRCYFYDADVDAIIPMSEAPGHIKFIEEGLEVL